MVQLDLHRTRRLYGKKNYDSLRIEKTLLKFKENIGITLVGNRRVHHGSKLERMSKNKTKLQEVILAHGNPLGDSSNEIMNLLLKI